MALRPVSSSPIVALADAEAEPVVVKLGGSVVRSTELAAWLDAIAAARQPIVVVPGGGALADEVRACQAKLGFGDHAAHRMALLAMDQLAWAVAGLRQGFAVGATETELRQALDQGQVAVWAPYGLISGRTDIEESWRITSDSLALWLAGCMGARSCYLIKTIARPKTARLGAVQLARDGVVDAAFPEMLKASRVRTFLLGRGEQKAFAASLVEGETRGTEID
jgi:5-(aminomethyl)-3-furanmethanol phosphate kinase